MLIATKVKFAAAACAATVLCGLVTGQVARQLLRTTQSQLVLQIPPSASDPGRVPVGNGVVVHFAGIAEWGSERWRRIDGEPAIPPATRPTDLTEDTPPPKFVAWFHAEIPDGANVSAGTIPGGLARVGFHRNEAGRADWLIPFTPAPEQQTVDLRVQVADGPWTRWPKMGGRTRAKAFVTKNGDISMIVTPLLIMDTGHTAFYVSRMKYPEVWRILGVDDFGQTYEAKRQNSAAAADGMLVSGFEFDVPPALITWMEVQSRSYNRVVTVKGISLDPSKLTKPQITFENEP